LRHSSCHAWQSEFRSLRTEWSRRFTVLCDHVAGARLVRSAPSTDMETKGAGTGAKDGWSRLGLIGLVILLLGCPYRAPFEPEGVLLPRDARLTGEWTCPDEKEQVRLSIGYTDASSYLFTFVSTSLEREMESPLLVAATPRRVAGRPVWTLRWLAPGGQEELYLAEVDAGPKRIVLRLVEDKLMPKAPRNAADLASALRAALGKPNLASEPNRVCTRE
jgi:hypothetical protein